MLTSNKGFEEWGQILGDDVMAAALIDRLLHHCHIVNIRGSSYRMRKHTDLSKILHSPPAESSPSPSKRKRARAREGLNNPHLGRNAIGCGSKIRFEDLSER